MDTTIDTARRCSKCNELGEETKVERLPRGAKELTFTCRNERCVWHNQTCSVVTVRADGSIPDPNKNRRKHFTPIPDRTEQVQAMLDAQLGAELTGRNNEIRGR